MAAADKKMTNHFFLYVQQQALDTQVEIAGTVHRQYITKKKKMLKAQLRYTLSFQTRT